MSLESWHAVVGLGTDGGQPLADRDTLAGGVHLLWTLRPDLGFPVGGYHVSRRAHRGPEWGCLNPENGLLPPHGATEWEWLDNVLRIDGSVARFDADACPPNGAVYLPGNASLTVAQAGRRAAVRAAGVGPAPRFEALVAVAGELRVVADEPATVSNGGWSAEAWCEGVVACRLSGDDLRVCTVCFADAQETGGWERLHDDPILTPVVAPGTANAAANLHGPDATRAEAYRRLSGTLQRDMRAALAEAFADLGELVEGMVREGRDAMVPSAATGAASARTPPRLGLPTGGSVALAAVDPDVSRMLGLYWHDPVQSGRWDYKVVAHHGAVRFPGATVTFDALTTGDVGSPSLAVGGVAFVGTAGLEVVASGRTKALRVAAPRIGTAAGLRLDPPRPAVTLRFDGNPVGPFAAWRGAQQVASGPAFLGAVTLEDADGIDAVTWSMGPLDLLEVELYERAGLVGDLTAYAWRLSPTPPQPVGGLQLTDAGSAVEPTRLHADGTVDVATGIVGLDWAAASPAHDVARPVRAHVGRASAAGGTPVVRNADRPAAAFASARTPGDHWAGPDVPHRWLERDLAPGSYAWSVRGIDVFGRLGEWSEERVVRVPAGTVPPPPDAVTAAYLDAADPYLSDDERALVDRDGPGLLVQWSWPAERRVAAPEVEPNGEFRVYARRGDPNVLEGVVLAVTDLGDHSRLRTDCTVPGGADGLVGQRLRVGGESFEVVGNTAGAGARIEVAHRTAPTVRPTPGPFTIDLSASSPLFTDLANARSFGGLIHTEPVGALPRVTSRIVSVVDGGASGTVALADALPETPADAVPGRLVSGGIAFRVLAQTAGSATFEVESAPQVDGSAALPAVGEAATLWTGARYRAWLPGAGELPAEGERWALTLVAVSACDVDAVVLHDPVPPHFPRAAAARNGGGGLEGPLSNVARVVVAHRGAPPAVEVALPPDDGGDIPAERAEPADWYGRAIYGLRFAAAPGADGYRVLRASVAAVFESDRGARQAGADSYAGGPFDDDGASEAWLAQNHPSVSVADLTADLETHPDAAAVLAAWRGWSAWFYPQKLNREVMALAELPCNEAAFRPAHDGIIEAPPFEDTLDGRGLGRFVYRVRPVDASGNTGPWSGAFPLVEVSDVTAPAMPVLVSLLAGENRVTVQWLKGPEPDLAEYRVWRAESRAALDDVRRLEPLAIVPVASDATLTYADEDLPGLRTFFYRVAAIDTAGNVSQPTAAAAAGVVDTGPPDPPAWIAAEWVADGVRLVWRAAETGLTCVLQRRPLGGGVWRDVSPELTPHPRPREFAFVDHAAVAGTAYEYRVLARDAAGNPSVDFAIRQVWPP